MKGDFTRDTFDPAKRYSSVRMQQGRVQLDADWNEQVDIAKHLRETALTDVIGACGVPREGGGFGIEIASGGGDLSIGAGRIYVEGVLCELDAETTYRSQRDFPDAPLPPDLDPPPDPVAGIYQVYLDVWQRHVTALEDPEIREVALGGPDTATRTRTVCQVKLARAGDLGEDVRCDAALPPETTAPSGRLRARARPEEGDGGPCAVPAAAGYTRLENQLYRVEVHDGGDLGAGATFKWSRDNGTVVTEWLSQDGKNLTVRSLGRDRVLGFHDAAWVELTDDERELRGEPGVLAKVERAQGDVIELDPAAPAVDIADFGTHPKVRRWDMPDTAPGAIAIDNAVGDGYLRLESGVQVRFEAGSYRTGDYWLIPARAFVGELAGEIEWPTDDLEEPVALPPRGIEHRYCKLALVEFDGGQFAGEVSDCRCPFRPLCDVDSCCCTVTVGDGVTSTGDYRDLATALTAAAAATPADTEIAICVLPGSYVLTDPVIVDRPRVRISGCGRPSISVEMSSSDAGFEIQAGRVTIEGLILRRLNLGNDSQGTLIRVADGVMDVILRDNELSNRLDLALESHAGRLRFEGNTLVLSRDGGGGIAVRGHDVLIAANETLDAVPLSQDAADTGLGAIHVAPGASNVKVVDNVLLGCPGHGITFGGLVPIYSFPETVVDPIPAAFVSDVQVARNRIEAAGGSGIASAAILRDPVELFTDLSNADVVASEQIGPAPIYGLRIVGNRILRCARSGPELGARDDGAPYGGIVLGHVSRLVIADNEIAGNGAAQEPTGDPAVPVVGIFVEDCRGLEIAGNVVIDNGLEGGGERLPGPEGGIVVLEATVELEELGQPGSDVPLSRPAGWSAAAIHDNRVEATRGLALQLGGNGPMQVVDNLFSRAYREGDPVGGAVLILNAGISPLLGGFVYANPNAFSAPSYYDVAPNPQPLPPDHLGGSVAFSGNQVRYDQHVSSQGLAVGVISLDDVAFTDNQIDCRVIGGTGVHPLYFDAVAWGTTVRAQSNRLAETLGRTFLSLHAFGLVLSTGTGNQGNHCILIERGPFGQKAVNDNLELCCRNPRFRLLEGEVGGSSPFPCPPPVPTAPAIASVTVWTDWQEPSFLPV